jgi:hypothetical protein
MSATETSIMTNCTLCITAVSQAWENPMSCCLGYGERNDARMTNSKEG